MKRFILKGIVAATAAVALFGTVVMLLWNNVVVDIFPLNAITYWQALGLLALCRLLFGSFGGGRRRGHRFDGGCNGHRNRLRKKLMKMSPEEREAFIKRIKKHRGAIHEHFNKVHMHEKWGCNMDDDDKKSETK